MTLREAIMAELRKYDGGMVVFYSDGNGKERVGAVTLPSPAFSTIVRDESGKDKWAVCGDIPPSGRCAGGRIVSARLFNRDMKQTQPFAVGLTDSKSHIEVESMDIEPGGQIHVTSISCDLAPPLHQVPKVLRGILAEEVPDVNVMGHAIITRAPGNHWMDHYPTEVIEKHMAAKTKPRDWKKYEPKGGAEQ